MMNAFCRNEEIRGTKWQFVGDTIEGTRLVTLRAGYRGHEDRWVHLSPVEIRADEGQSQKERFDEWVDTFVGRAREDRHA